MLNLKFGWKGIPNREGPGCQANENGGERTEAAQREAKEAAGTVKHEEYKRMFDAQFFGENQTTA